VQGDTIKASVIIFIVSASDAGNLESDIQVT